MATADRTHTELPHGRVTTPPIVFLCMCPDHQNDPHSDASNPLTLHERQWAFCPSGDADGHEWHHIEGSTLEEIRLWRRNQRRRNGSHLSEGGNVA